MVTVTSADLGSGARVGFQQTGFDTLARHDDQRRDWPNASGISFGPSKKMLRARELRGRIGPCERQEKVESDGKTSRNRISDSGAY
jgi:hypothetical protein